MTEKFENLKVGGRNPKAETRKPKSESATGGLEVKTEPGFWSFADVQGDTALLLREDEMHRIPAPLDERTVQFGEVIIRFVKQIPRNPVNERLISQLVGAATSIGANYCEADDSVSGKEFKLKIGTCRKESKETLFFPRMIASAEPTMAEEARKQWCEAKELNLIFGAIWTK
jgi:four helix bundle protein